MLAASRKHRHLPSRYDAGETTELGIAMITYRWLRERGLPRTQLMRGGWPKYPRVRAYIDLYVGKPTINTRVLFRWHVPIWIARLFNLNDEKEPFTEEEN